MDIVNKKIHIFIILLIKLKSEPSMTKLRQTVLAIYTVKN